MQDDPLEHVMEDDDFFLEEVKVTAPAPAAGPTQGTYVGKYGNSDIFPEQGFEDDFSYFDQRFSAFTTFSLFTCLIVMVTGAIFLMCMFLGYV